MFSAANMCDRNHTDRPNDISSRSLPGVPHGSGRFADIDTRSYGSLGPKVAEIKRSVASLMECKSPCPREAVCDIDMPNHGSTSIFVSTTAGAAPRLATTCASPLRSSCSRSYNNITSHPGGGGGGHSHSLSSSVTTLKSSGVSRGDVGCSFTMEDPPGGGEVGMIQEMQEAMTTNFRGLMEVVQQMQERIEQLVQDLIETRKTSEHVGEESKELMKNFSTKLKGLHSQMLQQCDALDGRIRKVEKGKATILHGCASSVLKKNSNMHHLRDAEKEDGTRIHSPHYNTGQQQRLCENEDITCTTPPLPRTAPHAPTSVSSSHLSLLCPLSIPASPDAAGGEGPEEEEEGRTHTYPPSQLPQLEPHSHPASLDTSTTSSTTATSGSFPSPITVTQPQNNISGNEGGIAQQLKEVLGRLQHLEKWTKKNASSSKNPFTDAPESSTAISSKRTLKAWERDYTEAFEKKFDDLHSKAESGLRELMKTQSEKCDKMLAHIQSLTRERMGQHFGATLESRQNQDMSTAAPSTTDSMENGGDHYGDYRQEVTALPHTEKCGAFVDESVRAFVAQALANHSEDMRREWLSHQEQVTHAMSEESNHVVRELYAEVEKIKKVIAGDVDAHKTNPNINITHKGGIEYEGIPHDDERTISHRPLEQSLMHAMEHAFVRDMRERQDRMEQGMRDMAIGDMKREFEAHKLRVEKMEEELRTNDEWRKRMLSGIRDCRKNIERSVRQQELLWDDKLQGELRSYMDTLEEKMREVLRKSTEIKGDIRTTCKEATRQLGESLKQELEQRLHKMESTCTSLARGNEDKWREKCALLDVEKIEKKWRQLVKDEVSACKTDYCRYLDAERDHFSRAVQEETSKAAVRVERCMLEKEGQMTAVREKMEQRERELSQTIHDLQAKMERDNSLKLRLQDMEQTLEKNCILTENIEKESNQRIEDAKRALEHELRIMTAQHSDVVASNLSTHENTIMGHLQSVRERIEQTLGAQETILRDQLECVRSEVAEVALASTAAAKAAQASEEHRAVDVERAVMSEVEKQMEKHAQRVGQKLESDQAENNVRFEDELQAIHTITSRQTKAIDRLENMSQHLVTHGVTKDEFQDKFEDLVGRGNRYTTTQDSIAAKPPSLRELNSTLQSLQLEIQRRHRTSELAMEGPKSSITPRIQQVESTFQDKLQHVEKEIHNTLATITSDNTSAIKMILNMIHDVCGPPPPGPAKLD